MRFIIILFALIVILPKTGLAGFDFDLSENKLEITAGFAGDTLTLFGTTDGTGDVIILVKGPEKETVIRRKIQMMGLWLHGSSVTFKDVPGYYNVASSKAISDITSLETRISNRLDIDSFTFQSTDKVSDDKHDRFQEALIQNMQLKHLFSLTPDAVTFLNDRLFKTQIYMPAHVPLGRYKIVAFLFQNGQLINRKTRDFTVTQIGMTGDIHYFSKTSPLQYGLLVIAIAFFSGLLATWLLRRE